VIDENGQNLGTMPTDQALCLAQERGLDLIEVAANARPPVCKIIDYGKYLYQQEKKAKQQKSKQTELKGIRLSFGIARNDMERQARQAEKFLNQGHKVKIEIILRGREKARGEVAKEKIKEFISLITVPSKIEQEPKKYPRGLTMVISKQ
jgi:translation initiation factor IF-3